MAVITLCEFGKLPAVRLVAPGGAQAIVTLFGAHLVSWTTGDGNERLFCSKQSQRDGSAAIRGGVPVIFPQFGARGDGLRHGFARISHWRLEQSGQQGSACFAQFGLAPGDLPAQLASAWPFDFALHLRITLDADELEVSLSVHNTGTAPFPFSAALHTYYLVDGLDQVRLHGLQHVRHTDQDHTPQDALQKENLLRLNGDLNHGKLDRIYFQVPGPLTLSTDASTLLLGQEGFTDVVVWNPGAADAALLADLESDEYRRFICVEPALIEPDVLAAGAQWTGRQHIVANWKLSSETWFGNQARCVDSLP
jgi:glucose-6-phosphate 1-epimerase